jgi:hypothetical protein
MKKAPTDCSRRGGVRDILGDSPEAAANRHRDQPITVLAGAQATGLPQGGLDVCPSEERSERSRRISVPTL